jgi:integrase
MADLNDPSALQKQLSSELRKLADPDDPEVDEDDVADIPEEDRQAIREFFTHLQANTDNKPQTNANKLRFLRVTSERADLPLVEMDKGDIDSFTVELQQSYDLSKNTINNYKAAWRPFFRNLGRDWADDIEFFILDDDEVEPWKVFTDEEVDAMIETATGRTCPIIAALADTGVRIGALLSTPRGNAELDGQVPVLTLNDHAQTKGAEGNIPLTFSRSYIASYLSNDHPRPDRDDVALFHVKEGYFDEDEPGAASYSTVRKQILSVMEEVGIEERRRKAHHFRHTAVTNWRRMGIPESVIQHRTKWADMSMLNRYSHLVDEDKDRMTAEAFGLIDPEETEDSSSPEDAVGSCPVCQSTVRAGARFCPGCGNPIDVDAAHDLPPDDVQDPEETAEDLADFDDVLDEMGTGAVLEQLLRNNPDLLDDLDLG